MSARRVAWTVRALDTVSTYLPVLLMALLALGTWWLVKNTPLFEGEPAVAPPRHEPDYTMERFTLQRFGADGSLRAQIEGDLARHFPDTETLEVDQPRIRAVDDSDRVTRATARLAWTNKDASEIQLRGDAYILREPTADEVAIEFSGEFLHYFAPSRRVQSNLPVLVTQGADSFRADSMRYDGLARMLELGGRVRATLTPPRRPQRR